VALVRCHRAWEAAAEDDELSLWKMNRFTNGSSNAAESQNVLDKCFEMPRYFACLRSN
jgi:hypothetical protein